MKKKIESELISIAHRLLKLKNPTETIKLQEEVKKLYDSLTILRFYEENIALVTKEISVEEFEAKLKKVVVGTIDIEDDEDDFVDEFENPNNTEVVGLAGKESIININEGVMANEIIAHDALPEISLFDDEPIEILVVETEETATEETIAEETIAEEIVEPLADDLPIEKSIEIATPIVQQEIIGTKASKQISIEDIFVHDYQDSVFEKKTNEVAETIQNNPEIITEINAETEKPVFGKAIVLGLNDKIAFEKHLFNGNGDDLNRVLSQLNTFDNLNDAKSFITDFVKPDYNNWQTKQEFEVMFLEIIDNKFK